MDISSWQLPSFGNGMLLIEVVMRRMHPWLNPQENLSAMILCKEKHVSAAA
jgi:hypothetical protein